MLLNVLTDRQTDRRRDRRETDLPKKRKEKNANEENYLLHIVLAQHDLPVFRRYQ